MVAEFGLLMGFVHRWATTDGLWGIDDEQLRSWGVLKTPPYSRYTNLTEVETSLLMANIRLLFSVDGRSQARDHDLEQINVKFLTSKWSGKIHTNYVVQTGCDPVLNWQLSTAVESSLVARAIRKSSVEEGKLESGADGWAGYE